jgi:deoxyribodipyrimidine photo-lyase
LEFTTSYQEVITKIENINPVRYAKTRNFIDGDITYLSPYISRGVISVQQILQKQIEKGYKLYEIEKFVQELCWREYWQRIWQEKGNAIFSDLKQVQQRVANQNIPTAIVNTNCGIDAVNLGINKLYETGYMHNHLRMYVASITCNIAQSHWLLPAQWMYYYLLDGDLASNHLSWQWVAGTNSSKKYYCNQENISKYTHSNQKKSYLAHDYEFIADMPIPEILQESTPLELTSKLPESNLSSINNKEATYIFNSYNLDPLWCKDENANRILLLEPSHFKKHPVSQKVLEFITDLSNNISNIQIYVGEFNELVTTYELNSKLIFYKEHPTSKHYKGNEAARDWISKNTVGNFNSFFSFYKKAEKEIKLLF